MNLELAERYNPIIYFHSKEPYFPGTVADYIRNSMLMYKDKVILENIIDPNMIVSVDIDPVLSNFNSFQPDWYVALKEDDKDRKRGAEWFVKGNDVNKDYFSETPSIGYYVVKGYYDLYGEYIDIVYTLPYPYNGTLSPHDYDEELVIVRLKNGVPDMVGLSAHGGYEWRNWNSIEKEDTRPIVYAAKESHAFYFEPKNHHRIFGFGSDLTDKGYRVDNFPVLYTPWKLKELSKDIKFLGFPGQRSKNGGGNFSPKNRPSVYGPRHSSIEEINKTIDGKIYNGILIALLILFVTYCVLTYLDFKEPHNTIIEVGQSIVGMVFFILVGVVFTITFNAF